jgi:HSP20 family protein
MALLQFDPFRELERWLDQQARSSLPGPVPMDAYRREDRLEVFFDLPGVSPDAIELTVERNVLTVSVERPMADRGEAEVVVAERPYGKFRRQVLLGENLDTEHVEASYRDGVLHVTIPLASSARARRIAIGSGEPAPAEAITAAPAA